MYRNGLLSVCLLWSGISLADCDMDNWVRDTADAWENNGVVEETLCYVELLDAMDLETALEYGRQYDEELQRRGHPVAAYKIGIHLPSVQPRFGLSGPLFGILHGEGALFENNGEVPVEGQALTLEPDFLLRVGSEGINEATSIEEAAQFVEAVCAFIELPVFLNNPEQVAPGLGLSAHFMQATSAGGRYGVVGECLNTADDPNIVENLRTMRVVGTDHTGTEQTFKDQQTDELHLLVTALMAADFLERRGQSLQPGDLISVGALQGNPRSASDAAGTGNRDPEWSNLHADSPAKHVSYYIGDRVLTVTANFR
ncbi:MAG: hypothetical protein OXI74_06050 [Rhodospirillaceae bacterium]|nr:hypothetical protein [Rhodospirillaceae bacterium]